MKTEAQVSKEFIDDLKSLLKKYNAEIGTLNHWMGHAECGSDIRMTVYIPGVYQDGETIREYTEIDLGESFNFKS
ncbi:MAG: hypothetical protein M0P12_04465 [Paludibacteraceae bacterium]|nr:hypothetical protein [Paludibacteraceae bacterium]MCK9615839.1 hypothetical protein [Candidatus Omnitrophota bacterium]